MSRLRDLLAHGGIAILALVVALAWAAFNLAVAISNEIISVLVQHLAGDDGRGFFAFTILGTEIVYVNALSYAIVVATLAAALFGVWALTRARTRFCGECLSRVPNRATVCRYCTSELEPTPVDA